jgi:hypothetical protein
MDHTASPAEVRMPARSSLPAVEGDVEEIPAGLLCEGLGKEPVLADRGRALELAGLLDLEPLPVGDVHLEHVEPGLGDRVAGGSGEGGTVEVDDQDESGAFRGPVDRDEAVKVLRRTEGDDRSVGGRACGDEPLLEVRLAFSR